MTSNSSRATMPESLNLQSTPRDHATRDTAAQAPSPKPSHGALPSTSASPAGDVDDGQTGLRAQMREMVGELIEYRELLWQFTVRNLRVRYKQAVMGFAWALLMPLVVVSSGMLIKFVMAQASGGRLNLESLAAIGVKSLPWAFFSGALNMGGTSVAGGNTLLTKIYFPREVFPLSALLTQAFDTAIGAAVLAIVLFGFLGVGFSWQLAWVLPLVLLLLLFTAGITLFLSCTHLFFRDMKYVVQLVVTFGMFFTPVFYEATQLGRFGCRLIMLNPIAPLLEGLRLAVVEQHNLLHSLVITSSAGVSMTAWHPAYLAYSTAWALVGFLGAWLLFHKFEYVYAEYA